MTTATITAPTRTAAQDELSSKCVRRFITAAGICRDMLLEYLQIPGNTCATFRAEALEAGKDIPLRTLRYHQTQLIKAGRIEKPKQGRRTDLEVASVATSTVVGAANIRLNTPEQQLAAEQHLASILCPSLKQDWDPMVLNRLLPCAEDVDTFEVSPQRQLVIDFSNTITTVADVTDDDVAQARALMTDPVLSKVSASPAPATTADGCAMEAHLDALETMTDQEAQIARLEFERNLDRTAVEAVLKDYGTWNKQIGFVPDEPAALISRNLKQLSPAELRALRNEIDQRLGDVIDV